LRREESVSRKGGGVSKKEGDVSRKELPQIASFHKFVEAGVVEHACEVFLLHPARLNGFRVPFTVQFKDSGLSSATEL